MTNKTMSGSEDTRTDTPAEVGNAAAEIAEAMRGRLDHLAALQRVEAGEVDDFSNDEILRLGLAYGHPGPIPTEQLQEEAGERLDLFALSVETITTFEIVLGVGGPSDSLLIECSTYEEDAGQGHGIKRRGYEINRVLYRYSWEGSAEVELTGEDREVAEEFARRVVPELVE